MQPVKYDPTKSKGNEKKKLFQARLKCIGETKKRESCQTYSNQSDCKQEIFAEQRCFKWFLCPHEYHQIQKHQCISLEDGHDVSSWDIKRIEDCSSLVSDLSGCLSKYQEELDYYFDFP